MTTPMQDGYRAGIRGDDPRLCPYEKLSSEWKEWQLWHGWGAEVRGFGRSDDDITLYIDRALWEAPSRPRRMR